VEGHCGSGVQVFALHDAEWREKAKAQGVAVLYMHALNPHGFSYGRRVTHENVDLNRNFIDFSKPGAGERALRQAARAAAARAPGRPRPRTRRPSPSGSTSTATTAYQAAVTSGQYQFDDGLFFGGKAPTWSNKTLREVLRRHAAAPGASPGSTCTRASGPNGLGERIYAGKDDKVAYARANAWWGTPAAPPVTSIYDGSSTSALLRGLMWDAVYEECPQAEYTGIALEYGTLPILEVTGALRADHWLHKHPEAPADLADGIRARMVEAFYTDTDAWRGQIVSQARQAMFQAVDGLSG
jgi:hypothetical protein